MEQEVNKKGLAVVYDPHNLYQFIWYYCSQGQLKEWDALCLPNGYKGEYMHTYCEDADIFSNIYTGDTDFSNMSIRKKIRMVIEMFFFFIRGKRELYCQKLLNQYIDLEEYDELVVIADVGIISGACVALGKEKKVVILEDGINDYSERPKIIPKEKITSLYNWQGFIMSYMGYCSPGWFWLKTDRFCIKYASQPEKMKYKNYKEIRRLYKEDAIDVKMFDNIIKKLYPAICDIDFQCIDSVLLTRPLDDFVENYQKYIERIEKYVNTNCKSILIKKHPRENIVYHFDKEICVQEVSNSIPAEVILPYLRGKEILLITTSAIMMYFKIYELDCQVIMFEGMYEESNRSQANFRVKSLDDAKKFCEEFTEGYYSLVVI